MSLPGFTEKSDAPDVLLFGGKPRAGLASTSLGELEDGVSPDKQLLEVLGDKTRRRRTRRR